LQILIAPLTAINHNRIFLLCHYFATTNLSRELGGKRLELFKEAVPKVARVAVLHDPTTPGSAFEVKEQLPVAARALGLTVRA
jgi:hypothetical protein